MPRGVRRTNQEEPLPNTVSEHEQLIENTKQLRSMIEQNVDRLREIRLHVGECINETETFLGALASGMPKPPARNMVANAVGSR